MKLRNKSGLIAAISGLTAVSLLSVGFAAWVLSATDEQTVAGTVQVETVNSNSVYLISNQAADGNFKFGTPSNEQISGYTGLVSPAWLSFDAAGTEKLTVNVTCDVTNIASQADATAHVRVKTFSASAGYDNAVTHNYVAALPAANTLTPTYVSGTQVSFAITLAWGSAFGGKNPYEYYNKQEKTSALITEAQTKLNGIATDLASVTYSVVLETF